jgi:hypothetical protein
MNVLGEARPAAAEASSGCFTGEWCIAEGLGFDLFSMLCARLVKMKTTVSLVGREGLDDATV